MLVHSGPQRQGLSANVIQEQFDIEVGETLALDLGGSGRPVIGRMFIENGEPTVLWQHARGTISLQAGF